MHERLAKPDVAAPGQNLVAPFAPGSLLRTTYPELIVANGPGHGSYLTLSGTEHGRWCRERPASRSCSKPAGRAPFRSAICPQVLAAERGHRRSVEYTALPMQRRVSAQPYDVMSQGVRTRERSGRRGAGGIDRRQRSRRVAVDRPMGRSLTASMTARSSRGRNTSSGGTTSRGAR